MFSTRPITSTFTWRNISIALRASCKLTSLGVETTTAPVSGTVCTSESTTSPVPGGRSTIRKSSSPHSTCCKNWRTIWCSMGPRITMGWSPGASRPMEMNFTPCATSGPMRSSPTMLGARDMPIMIGTFGP